MAVKLSSIKDGGLRETHTHRNKTQVWVIFQLIENYSCQSIRKSQNVLKGLREDKNQLRLLYSSSYHSIIMVK